MVEVIVSVSMSILAILDEGPAHGFQLKNEFESRTGSIWSLNVGQVYTTLARHERDGYVRQRSNGGEKIYEITPAGRARLRDWFEEPTRQRAPSRDGLVLKLVMAVGRRGVKATDVIQAERKAAVQELQDCTRLKRTAEADDDLGWMFLLDSLIFHLEARVRWLDACEARLKRAARPAKAARSSATEEAEVRR
jgi:DNA-binding PadR family transcriptional regulator